MEMPPAIPASEAPLGEDGDKAETPPAVPSSMASNPTPGRGLLDLPQEIQDMIFDLACPHTGKHKCTWKENWDSQELARQQIDRKHSILPYLGVKVDEFFV